MAQVKHAKVTLTGSLSLSVGSLRLVQNKTILVTDPKLIEQLKGQSGVSVMEFVPAPAKPAAPVAKPQADQKASEGADESEAAKAQLAGRRNRRPAGAAEAQG